MKLFVITGQTATGKTQLGIKLAEKYNAEIVNFDSRQVYRQLDIITGKDIGHSKYIKTANINGCQIGYYTINSLKNPIKIWLYDIVDPHQYFSSFDYVLCARHVVDDLIARGITPILIGGTYLYLKYLLYGADIKVAPDWELRNLYENKTVRQLQTILSNKMQNLKITNNLNNSDWHNPRRLIRKIEILDNKNSIISEKPQTQPLLNQFQDIEIIGLKHVSKVSLVTSIKSRVEKRLKQGAIDEVRRLLSKGYDKTAPGLKTIGYPQVIDYLENKIMKEQLINDWINKEVQYAKRQLTFMKLDNRIKWQDV